LTVEAITQYRVTSAILESRGAARTWFDSDKMKMFATILPLLHRDYHAIFSPPSATMAQSAPQRQRILTMLDERLTPVVLLNGMK